MGRALTEAGIPVCRPMRSTDDRYRRLAKRVRRKPISGPGTRANGDQGDGETGRDVADGKDPACVEVCPAKARTFGNLDDPESEASILIKRHRGQVLNPELGNKPKVYYLLPR